MIAIRYPFKIKISIKSSFTAGDLFYKTVSDYLR